MLRIIAVALVAVFTSVAHAAEIPKVGGLTDTELEKVNIFFRKINALDARKVVQLESSDKIYLVKRQDIRRTRGIVRLRHCLTDTVILWQDIKKIIDARVVGELDKGFDRMLATHDIQCSQEGATPGITYKQAFTVVAVVGVSLIAAYFGIPPIF